MVMSLATSRYQGRAKLRDQAYDNFIESLLASRIRPGQFLSQRELVAITGMPLGAIRELIPRLEADKLIETVPQRGMQVAAVDLALVRDAFEFWIVLEKAAAERFVETASEDDVEALAEAFQDLMMRARRRIDRNLWEEAKRLEWKLHDSFIEAFDNEILSDVYRVNSVKIQLIRMARETVTDQAALDSIGEQLAIVEALKLRDTRAVVAAVEAHLKASLRRSMGL